MAVIWFESITLSNGALIFVLGSVAYTVYGAIWRLFMSGPRFAAMTFWIEFYYDVFLGGRYTWKLLEYHERYGMKDTIPDYVY